MKHMAVLNKVPDWPRGQTVDLFHSTSDVDEEGLAKLAADAKTADMRLLVLIDARDGYLTGDRIREAMPQWGEASIWFCSPAGFGEILRRDFAVHDFPGRAAFPPGTFRDAVDWRLRAVELPDRDSELHGLVGAVLLAANPASGSVRSSV